MLAEQPECRDRRNRKSFFRPPAQGPDWVSEGVVWFSSGSCQTLPLGRRAWQPWGGLSRYRLPPVPAFRKLIDFRGLLATRDWLLTGGAAAHSKSLGSSPGPRSPAQTGAENQSLQE